MQLACPTCGTQIKALNINIQDKIAVCTSCDTVFKFDQTDDKIKRRKAKQPFEMTLIDDETLTMNFRTNWRLDRDQTFISSIFGAGVFIMLTNLLALDFLAGEESLTLPLIFAMIAITLIYRAMLNAYNHTSIQMDMDKVLVDRKPLPSLFNQTKIIPLHDVVSIHFDETDISKEHNYDTPRYIVWAETVSGHRRPIIVDVVEDYAHFITQKLSERLHPAYDTAHLEDQGISSNTLIIDNYAQENVLTQTSE